MVTASSPRDHVTNVTVVNVDMVEEYLGVYLYLVFWTGLNKQTKWARAVSILWIMLCIPAFGLFICALDVPVCSIFPHFHLDYLTRPELNC